MDNDDVDDGAVGDYLDDSDDFNDGDLFCVALVGHTNSPEGFREEDID